MGTKTLKYPVVEDGRFVAPLYTIAEAARYLDVPPSTFANWVNGYQRAATSTRGPVKSDAIVTSVPRSHPRGPVIPFVGLAEGLVLAAWRHSGVPLQRIRPALARLEQEFGLPHALASKKLYTDGAEVLYDYAQHSADDETGEALRDLVVVSSGQRVFNDVVSAYLRRLDFDDDVYARRIHLPAYTNADVLVDPGRGFGQPIFARGGARLEDALAMFRAGETLDVVAEEYEVPAAQLEDALRVALRAAA
ncbi:MAG: DUF433 domain-containing protein [Candidatus Nanopelagicales bacterium]